MFLTQVFVYCALKQESLSNFCGFFILFELNKCYVDTNIVMHFGNNTFYQSNNERGNRNKTQNTFFQEKW